MWAGCIQSTEDQQRIEKLRKREFPLPAWLSWNIGLVLFLDLN